MNSKILEEILLSECANCSSNFKSNKWIKLRLLSSDENFLQNKGTTNITAVSSIYGIPWSKMASNIASHYASPLDESLQQLEKSLLHSEKTNLAFCDPCAVVFAEIFKAHKKFEKLSKKDNFFSKAIQARAPEIKIEIDNNGDSIISGDDNEPENDSDMENDSEPEDDSDMENYSEPEDDSESENDKVIIVKKEIPEDDFSHENSGDSNSPEFPQRSVSLENITPEVLMAVANDANFPQAHQMNIQPYNSDTTHPSKNIHGSVSTNWNGTNEIRQCNNKMAIMNSNSASNSVTISNVVTYKMYNSPMYGPPYICPECKFVFIALQIFRRHCRMLHKLLIPAEIQTRVKIPEVLQNDETGSTVDQGENNSNDVPGYDVYESDDNNNGEGIANEELHEEVKDTVVVNTLDCSECYDQFNDIVMLANHYQTVHYETFILCSEKISSLGDSSQNKELNGTVDFLNKSVGVAFACETCGLSHQKYDLLRKHNLEVHNIELGTYEDMLPYLCSLCNRAYETGNGLFLHVSKIHKDRILFDCKMCPDTTYSKINELEKHMTTEHNIQVPKKFNSNITCEICDTMFGSKRGLEMHRLLRRPIDDSLGNEDNEIDWDTVCKFCLKGCVNVDILRVHQNAFHRRELSLKLDGPFLCDICDKSFTRKSFLRNHLSGVHIRKTVECKVCHRKVKYNYIDGHMRKAHTGKKPYKCDFCEKSFFSTDCKRNHEASHTDARPFICSVCGKGFKLKPALLNHEKYKHGVSNGGDSCMCEKCGKTFASKQCWKIHAGKLQETGLLIKCKICDMSFEYKCELTTHKNISHPVAVKNNKCPTCDKVVRSLERHECKESVPRKRFKCSKCEVTFVSKVYRQKHLEKYH